MNGSFATSRASGDLVAQIVGLGLLLVLALVWGYEVWAIVRRHRRADALRYQRTPLAARHRSGSALAPMRGVRIPLAWPRHPNHAHPIYVDEATTFAEMAEYNEMRSR